MQKLMTMLLVLAAMTVRAAGFDDIRQTLQRTSLSQLQEKVYVHTDNQCYFVGDTLWYKAYVVRADSLSPTPLSRILYVELLSPDGLLVERQQVIVSSQAFCCGQIVLQDSLYAGYYELRAYTRWMLNFGARPMRYAKWDAWAFYNNQMARDFYTQYDGLYSRVYPIYNRPERRGDFSYKGMTQRPYQRLPKEPKDQLKVKFYPEGGTMVEGHPTRIAFEATDQHGEAQQVAGTIAPDAAATGGQQLALQTEFMGRGSFIYTPQRRRGEAVFQWKGKTYKFSLPKAQAEGVTMTLTDGGLLHLRSSLKAPLALSVLCRGALKHFQTLNILAGEEEDVQLPLDQLPTGVADVTVFTEEGRIVADRLFFVNHHDHDGDSIALAAPLKHTYEPYEPIDLQLQLPRGAEGGTFSVAVRDSRTDEPSFYDGNLLTDLLLSSELRGFVAWPAHYFEADDDQHRRHLDLLMMVQGWRRYSWRQHATADAQLRYAPETSVTVEGTVYKTLDIADVEPEEVLQWQNNVAMTSHEAREQTEQADPFATAEESGDGTTESNPFDISADSDNGNGGYENGSVLTFGNVADANNQVGVNHGNLKREVMVEAEVIIGNEVFGSTMTTVDQGRFKFNIPPFYGDAYINIKAYREKDSLKKAMTSRRDKYVLQEDQWPDYYVKRDLFYPAQAQAYNFYQKNQPDIELSVSDEPLSGLTMENGVHRLRGVTVKGRRIGKRKIDYTSPVCVRDAYDLYNEMTDRGLSWGKLDMRQFPVQAARLLYGNMGRLNRMFNVDAVIDSFIYYRNYTPPHTFYVPTYNPNGVMAAHGNRFTPQRLVQTLKLKRMDYVRVFSDYEPRNPDSLTETSIYAADATVELIPIANDGTQITFRDRHIRLHGFNEAADFYQPDYSSSTPQRPTDHRRTLYWNPNARADEEGRFSVTFYNNSKQTRLHVSAAGVTPSGQLLTIDR